MNNQKLLVIGVVRCIAAKIMAWNIFANTRLNLFDSIERSTPLKYISSTKAFVRAKSKKIGAYWTIVNIERFVALKNQGYKGIDISEKVNVVQKVTAKTFFTFPKPRNISFTFILSVVTIANSSGRTRPIRTNPQRSNRFGSIEAMISRCATNLNIVSPTGY
jgi:hypothetical protein